jgi:hypothetical protein
MKGKSYGPICFKKLILKDFEIIINGRGNYVLLNDGTILRAASIIKDIQTNIYIYGQECLEKKPVYKLPCNSSDVFDIAVFETLSIDFYKVSYFEVKDK